MKKNKLKFLAFIIFILVGIFFINFYSDTEVSAQIGDELNIYTTGYSVLSAQSYIFNGVYSLNTDKKPFTTYFEFKKADLNTPYNINMTSSDLINLFNKSNDDTEKTIIIRRENVEKTDGDFYSSPGGLDLMSVYYFRAVGCFEENPNKDISCADDDSVKKYYGGVLTLDTRLNIPKGYTYPYSVTGIQGVAEPFVETEILAKTFWAQNITDKTADIVGRIIAKNAASLKLKVEYGEKKFDFISDELVKIDETGKASVTLKNLKPNTRYNFRLFDTTKKLQPSFSSSFVTNKTNEVKNPTIKANISLHNLSPESALFKAVVYNADLKDLELHLEYGKGNLDNVSFSEPFKLDSSETATMTLNGLEPSTLYKYRLIEANNHLVLSGDRSFATLNKTKDPVVTPPSDTPPNKNVNVDGGLVPCGTEQYGKGEKNEKGEDVSGIVKNPCEFKDIFALIKKVMNYLFYGFILPVSAIMFAYAGFLLVTSGGETEKRTQARNIFINVLIGLVVSLGAFLIVKTVLTIVGFDKGGIINMFGF